jgi:hypothetical protein
MFLPPDGSQTSARFYREELVGVVTLDLFIHLLRLLALLLVAPGKSKERLDTNLPRRRCI